MQEIAKKREMKLRQKLVHQKFYERIREGNTNQLAKTKS
jgi:hypothetical protein